MDHRGRPAFPGLVFNLVPAGDLSFTEDFEEGVVGSDEDGFVGVVYHVPLEDARHIIDELDFRERGGYERCTAEVELLEDTAVNKTGEKVNTTVYIGLASNPNFIHYGSSEGFFRKASIISAAYGPSGRNYEYLFRVVEYFRRNRLRDRYLLGLENAVRCRLGISRGHNEYLIDYYQSSTDVSSILLSEESSQELSASGIIDPNTDNTGRVLCRVFGLGSNEWGQLIRSSSCLSTKNIDDIYFTSTPSMCAVMDPSGSDSTPEARIRKLLGCHVLAGGSHSGLLTSGELHLWGSNSRGQLGPMKIPPSVCSDSDVTRGGGIVLSAALGHEHTLVLLVDGTVVSFGDDEYGQCSGTAADIPRPVSLPFLKHVKNWEGADDEYFWASIMLSSGSTVVDATIRVVHIAAGARHSVAITADGCIHCWGAGRHHQLMLASQPGWHPMLASGAEGNIQSLRFVDATAGMSHTLALDSLGRIWSWGHANRHGQLGRLPIASHTTPLLGDGLISTEGIEDERLPALVSGLPADVIWQRVSGSHKSS
jgi:cation transport regulator ChaC